ncbi:MAG: hypothetical protein J6A80_08470 [Lachnospiraceae bacterium]|nr:hypothetical protein [Lachnospiraceae bacterium]
MQKSAKTLLWIAMGIEVVYAIAALIGMVIGSAFNTFGTPDGSVYAIIIMYYVVNVGIPMVAKIILAAIVLSSLKENSEKIVTEIISIVLFSGILSIPSILINNFTSIIIAQIGQESLITYHYAGSGMAWVGFLHSISTVLFIVAAAFSIAYKKVELSDLHRILEEEDV